VRNLDHVHVLVADQLNTYDVLCAEDIVFTQDAFEAFVTGPARAADRDAGLITIEGTSGKRVEDASDNEATATAEEDEK